MYNDTRISIKYKEIKTNQKTQEKILTPQNLVFTNVYTGLGSLVGSHAALDASNAEIDPCIQHILS